MDPDGSRGGLGGRSGNARPPRATPPPTAFALLGCSRGGRWPISAPRLPGFSIERGSCLVGVFKRDPAGSVISGLRIQAIGSLSQERKSHILLSDHGIFPGGTSGILVSIYDSGREPVVNDRRRARLGAVSKVRLQKLLVRFWAQSAIPSIAPAARAWLAMGEYLAGRQAGPRSTFVKPANRRKFPPSPFAGTPSGDAVYVTRRDEEQVTQNRSGRQRSPASINGPERRHPSRRQA